VGSAASPHHTDHSTQQQAEDHDRRVVHTRQGRRDECVDRTEQRRERIEAGDEERAQPNPGEQRYDDLFEDERQRDGDQRRQDAEPSRQNQYTETAAHAGCFDTEGKVDSAIDHQAVDRDRGARLDQASGQQLAIANTHQPPLDDTGDILRRGELQAERDVG
jgi:hypothetical protein